MPSVRGTVTAGDANPIEPTWSRAQMLVVRPMLDAARPSKSGRLPSRGASGKRRAATSAAAAPIAASVAKYQRQLAGVAAQVATIRGDARATTRAQVLVRLLAADLSLRR